MKVIDAKSAGNMKAFVFGTFNPATNAHIQMGIVAKKVLGENCDIIYIPTSDRYVKSWKNYKEGKIMSGPERVTLLAEAVDPYGFSVTSIEVDGIVDGKTYNTLDYFQFENSVLCVGMDNVPEIRKWYRYKDLLAKYKLLIFKRGLYGERLPDILKYSVGYEITELGPEYEQMSSTQVRDYYSKGQMDKVKTMVPDNVYKYLKENDNVYF